MTEHPWQTIIGQIPSKPNSYKVFTASGHAQIAKTKTLLGYEKSFYMQVGQYRNLNIEDYFELHVRVFFTTMSHDLDNSLKILLDCLQNAKAIKNDNRCVKIIAEKYIDKLNFSFYKT